MSSIDCRPKTIICDIDGTLVEHWPPVESCRPNVKLKLLPGTAEKISEWDKKGYLIILMSGRRECARKQTEAQLSELGIIYDKLILGCGGGERVLINDRKLKSLKNTAHAVNINRDKGISEVHV